VILSEERLRDTPGYRANIAQTEFIFKNQRVPTRLPIGKVDIIKTAPVSQIAAYYHAHYRPEVTTLVVVGDVDIAAIEAKVKELFADWRNPTKAAPPVDWGTPAPRGLEAKVVVQPGASFEVDLDWMHPYDNAADVAEMRRRDTCAWSHLAFSIGA
jgi:zinc protease